MIMMRSQTAGQGAGNGEETAGQSLGVGAGLTAAAEGCPPQAGGSRGQAGLAMPGMEAGPVKPGLLPPLGTVVQAGAFGAVLGGATTGLVNTMRAHSGEISREEAVRETVQMAAQGAASMAIASVAAHAVRVHPTFGLVALVGVGVAALAMSRQKKKPVRKPV